LDIISSSFSDSLDTLKEKSFFGSAKTIYLIASLVVSDISIALVSCLLHASHLKPSSLILKNLIFSLSLQILHPFIIGLNPSYGKES
jgi:hypothetical protein